MKKEVSTLLFLTLITISWGQKLPQCDLLKTASIAFCQNEYDLALTTLNQFQKEFPEHALIEEVNQQVGHIYFLKGDFKAAKANLHEVINGKNTGQGNRDYNALECKTSWDSNGNDCRKIVFPERYVHLQHKACLNLYEIFKQENQLDSALKYLILADKEYVYNNSCANGIDMKDIQIALLFRDIHLERRDTVAAINELLKVVFLNEAGYLEVRKSLMNLLNSKYSSEQIKSEFSNAIKNVKKVEFSVDGKTYYHFEIQLFEQPVRIPFGLRHWKKDGEFIVIETSEQMQERLENLYFIRELKNEASTQQ